MSRRPPLGDAVRLAVGTLTALPLPPPRRVNPAVAGWAMTLAPVVAVLLLAPAAALVAAGNLLNLPPTLVATLCLAVIALTNRALHLDGLADTCDALASGYQRERSLTVMRTGDIGPAGVAALVLVLLIQVTALAAILPHAHGAVLAAIAFVTSRFALTWGCRHGVNPARAEGLGAGVAGTVPLPRVVAAAGILLVLFVLISAGIGLTWWSAVVVAVAVVASAELILIRAARRFGGTTGDVLGALVEVGLTVGLVAAAAVHL